MSVLASWLIYLGFIGICVAFGFAVWFNLGKTAARADRKLEPMCGEPGCWCANQGQDKPQEAI
jgi:hypothetical protein